MNALTQSKVTLLPLAVEALPAGKRANDGVTRSFVREADPFTRRYRRFASRLRAAARCYVQKGDVDDLLQDVWVVAAQSPAKLAQSDARTLAWLIGIAKRRAPSYRESGARFVEIDSLLAREAGDDLEGRGAHEDVEELRAELWGKDD